MSDRYLNMPNEDCVRSEAFIRSLRVGQRLKPVGHHSVLTVSSLFSQGHTAISFEESQWPMMYPLPEHFEPPPAQTQPVEAEGEAVADGIQFRCMNAYGEWLPWQHCTPARYDNRENDAAFRNGRVEFRFVYAAPQPAVAVTDDMVFAAHEAFELTGHFATLDAMRKALQAALHGSEKGEA